MIMRKYIHGIPVDLRTKQEIMAQIAEWLLFPKQPRQIITLNALMWLSAAQNHQFQQIIREADLITLDGRGILMALKKNGHRILEQVTGIELTRELLSWCSVHQCPVYFYGGSPAAAQRLRLQLPSSWPGLVIQGIQDGFGGPAGQMEIMEEIQRHAPGLLIVGLGSPAQEFFLARLLPKLKYTVGIGAGGTLDVLAGLKREAPPLIREHNLEWLYRMFQDPVKFKRLPDLFRFWNSCLR